MRPAVTDLVETAERALGRPLAAAQVAVLRRYALLLAAANERINLTAVREPAEIERRHVLESLALLALLERTGALPQGTAVIDVGSGGGVPGIPLAIARPDLRVTLLEVTGKKAAFLREAATTLELAHVAVAATRAEDAGRDPAHRERYDLAVARAVAPLDALAELTLPLVRVGGHVAAVKGSRVRAEVSVAGPAIERCGGGPAGIEPLAAPGGESLSAVFLEKVRPTPSDLPRRAGMPAKRPLR